MSGIDIEETNLFYMENLKDTYSECLKVLKHLRHKVTCIFWATLLLYTVLFVVGIALLSIPIVAAFRGDISLYTSIIGGTLGIIEVVSVLCLRPVERIHDLMGDMSQISMIINSYQQQVGLRALEFDYHDKPSIGLAAEKINTATEESLRMIQKYVESGSKSKKGMQKVCNEGSKCFLRNIFSGLF